ncbi:MAG: hypothetical protein LBL61_01235 [Elusimicrobiota bacterium]|jgi:hypothetical protein|nr:hypothetical protein [Elusimicrobiota bacterium]
MKKYLLPFFALISAFAAVNARADEYSLTSILSLPYGIFDTINVSGNVSFTSAEIGVRPWNDGVNEAAILSKSGGSYPVMQKQKITVHGNTLFTNAFLIKGTLQLEGLVGSGQAVFNVGNVNLNQYAYFSAGGQVEVSGAVAAHYFDIFGTLDVTQSSTTTPINPTGAVHIGNLVFNTSGGVKSLLRTPNPNLSLGEEYSDGSATIWKSVNEKNGSDENIYGPWELVNGTPAEADDTCNKDIDSECSCMSRSDEGDGLVDFRILPADTNISGTGGITITRVLGRKECRYDYDYNDGDCVFAFDDVEGYSALGYAFNISNSVNMTPSPPEGAFFNTTIGSQAYIPASCSFDYGEFESEYGSYSLDGVVPEPNGAAICNKVCSGNCSVETSCIITKNPNDDGTGKNEYLSGLDTYGIEQPGVTRSPSNPATHGCDITGWPAGTGLECKNAWEEKWFTVVTCGPGSGAVVSTASRYQRRTVDCKNLDPTDPLGTFLILDK